MTSEATDLFGQPVKPYEARGKKCAHLNASYSLPLQGTLRIRSRWEPGLDEVREVGRKVYWTGQLQGRCEDCGKSLYYGGSSIPKMVKSRLSLALDRIFKLNADGFGAKTLRDPGTSEPGEAEPGDKP